MPNDTIDPLPLEPEEEKLPETPTENPIDLDAYASDIRQDLLEETPAPKPPSGVSRLFSGIKGIFGRKPSQPQEEQSQQSLDELASSADALTLPEMTSTPMLDMEELRGWGFGEEESGEPEGEQARVDSAQEDISPTSTESAFDLYSEDEGPAPDFGGAVESPPSSGEEDQQPGKVNANFPFLDLSPDGDSSESDQEPPSDTKVTPFWEMYRIRGN